MARKPPKMPDAAALQQIVTTAIQNFEEGTTSELESAIGMLYLGYAFGWRVVYITHTTATVRKYEKILGIVAKRDFPEETHHSDRVNGFRVARTVSNFWKAIRGEVPAEGIRDRTVQLD